MLSGLDHIINGPYSEIGRTKAQYKDFSDLVLLKSLDRHVRIRNPKILNALLESIAILILIDQL